MRIRARRFLAALRSEWKKGGYKDWLDDQFWREKSALDTALFPGSWATPIKQGGLQLCSAGLKRKI